MNPYFVPKWVAELGVAEVSRLIAAGQLRVSSDVVLPEPYRNDQIDAQLLAVHRTDRRGAHHP